MISFVLTDYGMNLLVILVVTQKYANSNLVNHPIIHLLDVGS